MSSKNIDLACNMSLLPQLESRSIYEEYWFYKDGIIQKNLENTK